MIPAIILSVIAYLIGSLSSAIIVCKFLNLPDPRAQGSMNPGTTNVLRIGGKVPALITLSGDILKGFLPVLVGHLIGIGGFFLGLIAISAFLALSPIVGIAVVATWILMAAIFRYSSLAAITAAILAPIFMLVFADMGYFLPTLAITAMLVWRHLANIQRLRAGTERKISF